jgi:hypothetical protein
VVVAARKDDILLELAWEDMHSFFFFEN